MGCCVCGADDFAEDWQQWDDHPARRQWDVIKDLGAGAMAQVGWCTGCTHVVMLGRAGAVG